MQYKTAIQWDRQGESFTPKTYTRQHELRLGDGYAIKASSAPEFQGDPTLANPEELFSAAISSCYMLTFLYLAAVKGFVVDQYHAETIGTLAKNTEGKMAMTELTIKPVITFDKEHQPTKEQLDEMLKKAHDTCFISCSVKTQIMIIPEQVAA